MEACWRWMADCCPEGLYDASRTPVGCGECKWRLMDMQAEESVMASATEPVCDIESQRLPDLFRLKPLRPDLGNKGLETKFKCPYCEAVTFLEDLRIHEKGDGYPRITCHICSQPQYRSLSQRKLSEDDIYHIYEEGQEKINALTELEYDYNTDFQQELDRIRDAR